MRNYANTDKITYVCRGGVFGGHKNTISKVSEIYYSLLSDSLNKGLMGTEESIFTIIAHKYPDIVDRVMINYDGLIGTFFENLKNNNVLAGSSNQNFHFNCINNRGESRISKQSIEIDQGVEIHDFKDDLIQITGFPNIDRNFFKNKGLDIV